MKYPAFSSRPSLASLATIRQVPTPVASPRQRLAKALGGFAITTIYSSLRAALSHQHVFANTPVQVVLAHGHVVARSTRLSFLR